MSRKGKDCIVVGCRKDGALYWLRRVIKTMVAPVNAQ